MTALFLGERDIAVSTMLRGMAWFCLDIGYEWNSFNGEHVIARLNNQNERLQSQRSLILAGVV